MQGRSQLLEIGWQPGIRSPIFRRESGDRLKFAAREETPMSESEVDTERVAVRTYLPAYQREEWDDHAEELGMSRSEFVKTMVQAGRRVFDGEVAVAESESVGSGEETTDPGSGPAERVPAGDLETQVLDALAADQHRSWEELLAAVTDDIEERLESTLQDLQAEGRVTYSGRNGGYTLDE